jgi:hypothetical protein
MTASPNKAESKNPHSMEIPEDIPIEYTNLVRIAHSPMDLVFDFAQLLPGGGARVRTRVVMSPLGAKLFLRALIENLNKYESAYGEIQVPGDTSLADFLFKPTPPPDKPQPK